MRRDIQAMCYGLGFTHWLYRSHKRMLAVMTAPHFFSGNQDQMSVGDLITLVASDGTDIWQVAISDVACVILKPMGERNA